MWPMRTRKVWPLLSIVFAGLDPSSCDAEVTVTSSCLLGWALWVNVDALHDPHTPPHSRASAFPLIHHKCHFLQRVFQDHLVQVRCLLKKISTR